MPKHSRRHKIRGGGVDIEIPPIIRSGTGGTDAESALKQMTNSSNQQANLIKALTGGSGDTYTVPTFPNAGNPYSTDPNPNSITRSLVGAYAKAQVDSEFDKNAFNQSGGRHKLKKNKSRRKGSFRKIRRMKISRKSRTYRKSKKSRKPTKSRK